jgi:hypothetical protein
LSVTLFLIIFDTLIVSLKVAELFKTNLLEIVKLNVFRFRAS